MKEVLKKYKIIIFSLTAFCLLLSGCDKGTEPKKFEKNPNLIFLTASHPPENDNDVYWECSSPVWSPDGYKIYYLESRGDWPNGGGIWVVDSDGQNAHKIKEGKYQFLSISPSGERLSAIRAGDYDDSKAFWIGGDVVVFHTDGSGEETVFESSKDFAALDVKFASDNDEKLFYYALWAVWGTGGQYKFYSYNLAAKADTFLFGENWNASFYGFDVHGNTIVRTKWPYTQTLSLSGAILDTMGWSGIWPRFSPDGEKVVAARLDEYPELFLFDASSGEVISYLDVRTHRNSAASFPAWSPDGEKIAFVTAPYEECHVCYPLPKWEVWILNDVQ